MSSQWEDAFNEAVERRVRMLQAAQLVESWSCCGQTFTGPPDFISGVRAAHVCPPEDVPDAETAYTMGKAAASAATPDPPGIGLVTVRYHGENGWWADSDDLAGWTATSDTLDSLRAKAREGVFMVTGKYPSLVHGMTTGNEGYDTFDLLTPLGAASPDERLREAGEQLANLVTLLGGYDGPGYLAAPNQGEHPDYYAAAKLFDRIMRDEKTGAAVVLAQWRAALAAADREALEPRELGDIDTGEGWYQT